MRLAKDIAATRQLSLQAESYGMEYIGPSKETFEQFFQRFIDNYKSKDFRKYTGALQHYRDFIKGAPFYLNQKLVDDFSHYLRNDAGLKGETPRTYFSRFKRICKEARAANVIRQDPDKLKWKLKFDRHAMRKEVLTESELNQLAATPCGNEAVKRMFFFCCNTGLRFGDARNLKWKDIKGRRIKIEQGKTGRYIYQDLNNTAKRMAGAPGKESEPVFNLNGIDGINKVIEAWYKRAKLEKHITTHCARHTFCTNLMKNKVDYRTIIGCMGWSEASGMQHLARYAHLVDDSVKMAVDTLPEINF